MTDTGIIRKLDALGRIVFPKELRDTFGWETGIKEYRICPSCAAKCVSKLQAIAEQAD
jgi:transcriptional pleiotropic regulator of transition state genes